MEPEGSVITQMCRSDWPRRLRRGSSVARLLGLRGRIPLDAWMFVLCESCVLSGRGPCVGLITRPEGSYRVWCVLSVIVKPRQWGGPGPLRPVVPWGQKYRIYNCGRGPRLVYPCFNVNFNIILLFTSRSSKCLLSCRLFHQDPQPICFPHTCHVPCPAYSSLIWSL
jgi:hypothetical protein